MTDILENNAVIFIGNGFDVAMGYKTKYADFYESEEFTRLANHNKLVKYIREINQRHELWTDLETALFEFTKECFLYYNGSDSDIAKNLEKDFNELRTALFAYLKRAQAQPIPVSDDHITGLVNQWVRLPWQVVSFNYTTVDLDRFSLNGRVTLNLDDTVNHTKFIYQHGSLYNTSLAQYNLTDSIVLGIDETQKVRDNFAFLYKNQQKRFNIKELFTYVASKDIIIIYGCSMGQSDSIYFRQIFQKQHHKTFIIYGYTPADINNIRTKIREWYGNYDSFELNNNVHFIHLTDTAKDYVAQTKKIIDNLLQQNHI